ncbi:DUF1127 domain-containing protein [Shimia sp.]|uniref:DUF1127 domain-containing protein n=1 Tax=Shimia sp. TaxID=1954381 RepID=UPI0032968AA3
MAYATTTHAPVGFADRIRTLFSNLRLHAQERVEYTRTFKELSRLTNRELADIGLRRCDIADACTGTFIR